jgi:hypothetical protein
VLYRFTQDQVSILGPDEIRESKERVESTGTARIFREAFCIALALSLFLFQEEILTLTNCNQISRLGSLCLVPFYLVLTLQFVSSTILAMSDPIQRRASFHSAPDHSRAISERQTASRRYQTFSPILFRSQGISQEAHSHRTMELGQLHLVEFSSPHEVEHYEGSDSDQKSTTYYSARSSQGEGSSTETPCRSPEPTFDAYQEESATVRFTPDPRLRGTSDGSHTLPLRRTYNLAPNASIRPSSPDTTIAEEFYRSSRPYRASPEQRKTAVGIDRTPTPFPRTNHTAVRRYATLPFPSSQRQECIYDPALSYEPPSPTKSLSRTKPPPSTKKRRLPADYRPETPFSFDKPYTPTPFSSKDARTMSPSHPLYKAQRWSGVDLEMFAMNKAMARNGAKLHRTMWKEEIEEMGEDVNEMMSSLAVSDGFVRDANVEVEDVVESAAEEVEEQKQDELEKTIVEDAEEPKMYKKKGKFKWFKKLLLKKKPVTEPDQHNHGQQETLETESKSSSLRPPKTTGPEEAPRNFSGTTSAANSSQSSIGTTSSDSSQEKPAPDSPREPARGTFRKQVSRKQAWWHIRLPRSQNRVPKVQRTTRSRTSGR